MHKTSIAENIMGALLVVAAMIALALLSGGCTSTYAEWGGERVITGPDGQPLVAKDGTVQKAKEPVKLSSWRHWTNTNMTTAKLTVKKDEIALDLNGYKSEPSEELNKVIETSFKGATELAAKISAAIATSGGSVAGEAGYTLLKNAITNYLKKGGNAENATVTCTGGNCTITDGSVTETCTNCFAK